MGVSWPAVNAMFNGASGILLAAGYVQIKCGHWRRHRVLMLGAFAVSVAFLISYLAYHAQAGVVRFRHEGWIRPVYFSVLITHTLLAAAVPVLAVFTLVRALRGRFDEHRHIARWTLPIWLYVSVTGVAVYLMLYRL